MIYILCVSFCIHVGFCVSKPSRIEPVTSNENEKQQRKKEKACSCACCTSHRLSPEKHPAFPFMKRASFWRCLEITETVRAPRGRKLKKNHPNTHSVTY